MKKLPQPSKSPKMACEKKLWAPSSLKSLKVIEKLEEAGKEVHLKVRNTKKCYLGHVKQGREWLTQHFLSVSSSDSEEHHHHPPTPEGLEEEDLYTDPMFPHAFNRVLNRCSDRALILFLTYKGFHQSLSKGTVEGVHFQGPVG